MHESLQTPSARHWSGSGRTSRGFSRWIRWTTQYGLKLGLTASGGDAGGKAAVKAILLLGLNVRGVYAEVSEGVERIVAGRVPEVRPDLAEQVLGKAVVPHKDGRHYTRDITNVGPKTKLLVGKPVLE